MPRANWLRWNADQNDGQLIAGNYQRRWVGISSMTFLSLILKRVWMPYNDSGLLWWNSQVLLLTVFNKIPVGKSPRLRQVSTSYLFSEKTESFYLFISIRYSFGLLQPDKSVIEKFDTNRYSMRKASYPHFSRGRKRFPVVNIWILEIWLAVNSKKSRQIIW